MKIKSLAHYAKGTLKIIPIQLVKKKELLDEY